MQYTSLLLAIAISASALPAAIEKRNYATTQNPAAPGQIFCDVNFGDQYFVHVGEPWNDGRGCDDSYHLLAGLGCKDN
jgi:hypothetical protein